LPKNWFSLALDLRGTLHILKTQTRGTSWMFNIANIARKSVFGPGTTLVHLLSSHSAFLRSILMLSFFGLLSWRIPRNLLAKILYTSLASTRCYMPIPTQARTFHHTTALQITKLHDTLNWSVSNVFSSFLQANTFCEHLIFEHKYSIVKRTSKIYRCELIHFPVTEGCSDRQQNCKSPTSPYDHGPYATVCSLGYWQRRKITTNISTGDTIKRRKTETMFITNYLVAKRKQESQYLKTDIIFGCGKTNVHYVTLNITCGSAPDVGPLVEKPCNTRRYMAYGESGSVRWGWDKEHNAVTVTWHSPTKGGENAFRTSFYAGLSKLPNRKCKCRKVFMARATDSVHFGVPNR
jgi:hypothetical protein